MDSQGLQFIHKQHVAHRYEQFFHASSTMNLFLQGHLHIERDDGWIYVSRPLASLRQEL
jgi:hypothetical protein